MNWTRILAVIFISMTPLVRAQQARTLYFPQYGNGGGFASDLVIYNPSARTSISGEARFWDEEGNLLSDVPMTARVVGTRSSVAGSSFVLGPQGSVTFAGSPQASQRLGSASVSTDGPISGVVRFRIPGIGIAGVGASEPALSLIAPVRCEGEIDTGVAVRNVHSAPVDVNLTLLDEQGNAVPGGSRTLLGLQPDAREARFISELFPDAQTAGFRGTLSLRPSQGKLAAVALELGQSPGEFTTLPVSALDAPPPNLGSLSGTWSGTTGQGLPITFTVSGSQITSLEGEIRIEGQGCASSGSLSIGIAKTILENSFVINSCLSFFIDTSHRIQGVFTSSTTAEGSWLSSQGGLGFPVCEGETETTWSAVKQ